MATLVRILPKYCSCLRPLGKHQRQVEELEASGTRLPEVINQLGWIKICCRTQVFTVPTYFIRDQNRGVLIDETGLVADSANYDVTKSISQDGPPVLPRRRPPPFPALPGI